MNMSPEDPKRDDPDDLDADPQRTREWQLQEGAREAHRQGDPPVGDARALRYRLIARALDREPQASLPSNFAYVQAQRIESLVAERRRADARFIRRLRWAFALGYGGAIAVAALAFREELSAWLTTPAIAGVLGSPWLLAGLGCAAVVCVVQFGTWHGMRR
jgi:hypothetical protein